MKFGAIGYMEKKEETRNVTSGARNGYISKANHVITTDCIHQLSRTAVIH